MKIEEPTKKKRHGASIPFRLPDAAVGFYWSGTGSVQFGGLGSGKAGGGVEEWAFDPRLPSLDPVLEVQVADR